MNWLDKHQMKVFWFSWFCIVLVCVFIFFSYPVHAESSLKKLPYDYSWNYTSLSESQIEVILNQASRFIDTSSENLIIFFYEPSSSIMYPTVCVAVVDSVTLPSNSNYDNVDLVTQPITFHFSSSTISLYYPDLLSVLDPLNQSYSPIGYSFFGFNATYMDVSFSPYGIYRNMPLYGTVELDNQLYIGTPENDPVIEEGHATEPINDPDNFINGIDGHPLPKPDKPSITPYTPPVIQFPSIDTSTLETLVESLIDVVSYGFEYLFNVLSGYFSNLLNNLVYF